MTMDPYTVILGGILQNAPLTLKQAGLFHENLRLGCLYTVQWYFITVLFYAFFCQVASSLS